jgi:hypothetical protein
LNSSLNENIATPFPDSGIVIDLPSMTTTFRFLLDSESYSRSTY